jgi:hypothetical protein
LPVGREEEAVSYGDSEHAASITEGGHPGVRDALQWLTYSHLPETLRIFSQPFYTAAVDLIDRIPTDSPELTTALNKLIEAKDSAVRAGIKHQTGRAGSVPRPQEVVDPPRFGQGGERLPIDPSTFGDKVQDNPPIYRRPIKDNPQA